MPVLRRSAGLAWFRNEHDETPAAILAELSADEVAGLAEALVRARDGQFVLGRAVAAREAAMWPAADHAGAAPPTYQVLAPGTGFGSRP